MNLGELLAELNRRGLEVRVEGEALRLRGPKGAASAELRQALAEHKPALLELLRAHDQGQGEAPIVPVPRTGPAPLSYGQTRLWFLDRLEPGGTAYNLMLALQVEGHLDVAILARCFTEVIRRHEILRTRYAEHAGVPVQIVDLEPPLDFRVLDERDVLAAEPGGVEAFLLREGRRPFDLATGPLLRFLVIERGAQGQYLQLCLHHIAADVWAQAILVREIVTLYGAFASGQPSPLPQLTLQYSDFAAWQRDYLQGDVRRKLVDYWRKKLEGAPPLLELPTDHARPKAPTNRGGEVRFEVGPELTAALKAQSHAARTTPFVGMLSAFFVLLHRLTGRDDLVLGANSINRSRTELEPLVGFFVDNLVMRVDLGGDPGFATVLERVRETVLDAFAHQDLPFDLLVEELRPARSLGFNPLFQVVFAWVRASSEAQAETGLRIRPLEFEANTSRFDLSLFVDDHGDRLSARMVFSRDLFEQRTIQHYVDCFQVLLAGLVAEPQRPVGALPMLHAEDRRRVLRQWNDTGTPTEEAVCLHALIEAQALRTPDAVAVVVDDWELTYGELDQLSDRVAAALQELDVGPEVVVGVYLDRSPELIVSLLGVLKAGGAFLALDVDEPADRLRHIVADARPRVLISTEKRSERLWGMGGFVTLHVDDGYRDMPAAPGQQLRRDVLPDQLAYILYTSGSTGRPKGTELTHRSIVNYLRWSVEAYRLREGTGSPVIGSVSFDGTLTSLFAPLLAGRALFLVPRGREIDVLTSRDYAEQGFSFIKMTPSHLRAFNGLGRTREVLGRTHAVVLGGEGLHGVDLAAWRAQGLPTRVINEYGPTEAAVACCFEALLPEGAPPPERVPIGRPIPHMRLYILDRHLQPVPVGVAGELYIGGVGLARGYLRRPDLTAERFVPNPFEPDTAGPGGSRLYRTGDHARYLSDGRIEYLGRQDDQLKIRGHRVESGEVEAALGGHPDVVQAAVVLQRPPGGAPRLVAYVQPRTLERPDDGDLRAALRQSLREVLPEYMLPEVIALLPELPLTPSGKIDRKALPPVVSETPTASGLVRTVARTGTEQQLQALFGELLGLSTVAPTDSFFELGGHSLLAVTLISRISEKLNIEVPLNEVFDRPTVESLASWIDEHAGKVTALIRQLPPCVVALKPLGRKPPLFLAPPSAGSPAVYVTLARHLDAEQPVFGFQMPGVMDDQQPPETIEDTAALYVAALRQVQPRGPYRIAGWSYGGLVVCEMARQLEALGEQVALLGLIDGAALDRLAAHDGTPQEIPAGSQLLKVLGEAQMPRDYASLRLIGEWMGISLPETWTDLLRRGTDGQYSYLWRFLRDSALTARNFLSTRRSEQLYTFSSYGGAATLYRTGPVTVGGDPLVDSVRRFALAGTEVIPVPGNHMTLIMDERNVVVLANEIQKCLDRVLTVPPIAEVSRAEMPAPGLAAQLPMEVM
ncbi:non-ribosomal peptide synthetase [Corallococcus macrosporus]|uniref:Non-ribosomal peptide synthetase n=1 Tax=Corallococcus macrosporus DSM 14697 TaxID=1189310 RepID=A0A250JYL5_9BACT|nr:non-ribosomal peptide synthetase [Corallococcus macrosporus]ATB48587.1 non-ribosomal peptide synthetase [Corallococcus macrosporus DSM 14697]